MDKYRIISHTHWDREWYLPFEEFRYKLVDLIDSLFDILEKNNKYIFHLDAQTVVLEDYLEIRPQMQNKLKEYIKAGNIIVGPWYLQNDFYLTSGEATVRNLLIGMEIAKEFGACSNIGCAPDQFGNISQLPQILNDFGIDTFLFARGYQFLQEKGGEIEELIKKNEFYWKGYNNTKVIASYMKFWYNNAQRFSSDINKAMALVELNDKNLKPYSATPMRLLMNGVDHLEPQDNLLQVVEQLKQMNPNLEIKQVSLKDYFDELKQEAKSACLDEYSGALDNGHDYYMLRGCWSSRSYLKVANVKAQNMLENVIEPLYTAMAIQGFEKAYDSDILRYLWKSLLKNHPHDSICGCSRDEVHANMEDRYARIEQLSKEYLRRGLETIATHIKDGGPNDYVVLAFNNTEKVQNSVVTAVCTFPKTEGISNFVLKYKNKQIPFKVIDKQSDCKNIISAINLPGVMDTENYTIQFCAKVQPFTINAYVIQPIDGQVQCSAKTNGRNISNEFYKIYKKDNKLCLLNKSTGCEIENFITFEDCGDKGDAYVYVPVGDKLQFDLSNAKTCVSKVGFTQTMEIDVSYNLPSHYDFEQDKRVGDAKIFCNLKLTLNKNDNILRVQYKVKNNSEYHRFRIAVDTGIATDRIIVDVPFCIETHSNKERTLLVNSKTFFNTSFATLCDNVNGMALLTQGLHEVERDGTKLYLTIARATGVIGHNNGKYFTCPDNQVKRDLIGEFGIYTYKGNAINQNLIAKAKQERNALITYFTSKDRNKFSGGRFAVQDTNIAEFFYKPDQYAGKHFNVNKPIFEINNDLVCLSALKKVEKGNGYIIRLVNMSNEKQDFELKLNRNIYKSSMSEVKGEKLGKGKIAYSINPFEIATFFID